MGDMVMGIRDRKNAPQGRIDAQGAIDWDSPESPLDQIRDKGLLSGFYGDFNPSARELAHALRNRETRAQKMLARLRLGPCTTFDLMMLGGAGFSSRLKELRRAGHVIEVEGGPERFVYTLKKA
mgnify:CR=1 FL=1